MEVWQSLPTELQLRDAEIASLSTAQVDNLFIRAKQLSVLEPFTNLFWDAMNRIYGKDSASMQRCVELLEERKRTLGRAYAYRKNSEFAKKYFAIRYNECEYNIRWLVEQYNCKRKTKNYLLEVKQ